jgi:trehalose-6-phosphate synthase
MKKEVIALVREIEEEFGKGAIQYMERDLVMEERIALWGISNTLLITTLRDG